MTLPNHAVPAAMGGSGRGYQHGKLWVDVWPYGVTLVGRDGRDPSRPGWLDVKVGWYRYTAGRLRITGVRLDGAAPHLRADVPAGYGDRGFQVGGISFPSQGCWRITGTVGRARLSFVTIVMTTRAVRQEVPGG